jgi:hypothetical protein
VQEMCNRAEAVYRQANLHTERAESTRRTAVGSLNSQAGLALLAAASASGQLDPLRSIVRALRSESPELAAALGLDELAV